MLRVAGQKHCGCFAQGAFPSRWGDLNQAIACRVYGGSAQRTLRVVLEVVYCPKGRAGLTCAMLGRRRADNAAQVAWLARRARWRGGVAAKPGTTRRMDLGGAQAGISLIVVVHSMVAAACLTLAAVHLAVWSRNRDALANLSFAIVAASAAANAIGDMVILKAQTPEIYAAAQRWKDIPILLLLVGLAGFSYHYLKAGRRWLALTAIGLRLVALVINFSVGESLDFLHITALRSVQFMGESVAVAVGVRNPWQAIGQLALLVLALFFADASITAWRRGNRAVALFVGGSLTFYMLASVTRAYWVFWQGALGRTLRRCSPSAWSSSWATH